MNNSFSRKSFLIKIIAVISFLSLFPFQSVLAFRFEDYGWGNSVEEIKSQIRRKGKTLQSSGKGRSLMYNDRILDESCRVTLEFTPKTKVLASIKVFWIDKNIGIDVKKLLVSKYGDYYQPNVFMEEYYWHGPSSEYDQIVLEYDYAGTTLTYFGGIFQQRYEKEFSELIDSEKKRF